MLEVCRKAKLVISLQTELGYGVTVALQILVLAVQVRILISQLEGRAFDRLSCLYSG